MSEGAATPSIAEPNLKTLGASPLEQDLRSVRYRLKLLGPFELTTAFDVHVAITSRRARALLSYLYLQPRRAESRSRLAGLLWSDRGEAQARASLRQCLGELKSALAGGEGILVTGREEVRLVKPAFSCDVQDIQDAASDGDLEALALLLLQVGEAVFLENVEVPGLFSDWLEPARELFERQLASGVYALLRASQARGDWPQVRALADAYLGRNPTDETVATLGMRAEVALGDASAARRSFQRLTSALEKAFQAAPGAEARDVIASVSEMGRRTAVLRDAAPLPSAADIAGVQRAQPPLVVVAAFEATDRAGQDAELSGAIWDEVLAGLSCFREFRVTAASAGVSDSHLKSAARGDAAYILGARLRRAPDGLRLLAQLMRASDQEVIWSERIEVADAGVSHTIEHIITKVVGAVSPNIEIDMERRARERPDSLYHRYVAARGQAERPAGHPAARGAASELETLIGEHPDFGLAYLPLARLYNTDFTYTQARSTGTPERERAFALAKAALAIDRRDMYAYTVLGWCYLWRRNWNAARAHFEQAVRLNPYHADRLMDAGFGHLCLGDVDLAASLFERCIPLTSTPKDRYYIDFGLLEMVRGDHARASAYLEFVAAPTVWVLLYRAVNAILAGQESAALNRTARERVNAVWPADQPADSDLLIGWVGDHHPLAEPLFAGRFLDAARRALTWPGGTPSGCA